MDARRGLLPDPGYRERRHAYKIGEQVRGALATEHAWKIGGDDAVREGVRPRAVGDRILVVRVWPFPNSVFLQSKVREDRRGG